MNLYNNYTADEDIKSGGGGSLKFGINRAMMVDASLQIDDETGNNYLNLEFLVKKSKEDEGTKVSTRVYEITKVVRDNVEYGLDSDEARQAASLQKGFITHLFACFMDRQAIQNKIQQTKPTNFVSFIQCYLDLLPQNFRSIKIHMFLRYQWQMKGSASRTYLEIPSNRKHGKFFVAASDVPGKWEEVIVENPSDDIDMALSYRQGDLIHPFSRTGWYMNSPFANQQQDTTNTPVANLGGSPTATVAAATVAPSIPIEEAPVDDTLDDDDDAW